MARTTGRGKLGKPNDPNGVFVGPYARTMRSEARVILDKKISELSSFFLLFSPLLYTLTMFFIYPTEKKTRDKQAVMWYDLKYYHSRIFIRRRIKLIHWPAGVPFRNLSRLTEPQITVLHDALKKGGKNSIQFVDVSDEEASAHACDPLGVAPGRVDESDITLGHPGRNDVKRSRLKNGKPVSKGRKLRTKGAITPKFIDDAMDA